jgi:hypothetical protein
VEEGEIMPNKPMAAPYTKFQFTRDVYGGTNVPTVAADCDGCGMPIVGVHADRAGHVHCRDCGMSCIECQDFLHDVNWLAEFYDDNELVVTIAGKRGKECFGFYANVWFRLDSDFQRTHQVKNVDRIRELNKRSGRTKVIAERKIEKSREQAIADYQEKQLESLVCDCWSDREHEIFPVEEMHVYDPCPVHAGVCGSGGNEHPIGIIEGQEN